MKEAAEILYDMCLRLGAIVDARDGGERPEGSSFDMVLDAAWPGWIPKSRFRLSGLQGKLNVLRDELLEIQKGYNIEDTQMAPAA